MARPGAKATYLGPCVAASAEPARALIAEFLGTHEGDAIYWDILPSNGAAIGLAREFGFAPVRSLSRMAIPGRAPLPHDDSLVFAIAGFEYG